VKVCPVCGTEYGEEAAFCSRDRSPLRAASGETAQRLVGQLVGERYQVERRLGAGGMGEVYLARHILMGRPCALKVMTQELSHDPDAVSRFNREASSASRISHPNVCTVYDFGLTADGLVYLAMEYVEGRTLSDLLEEGGPLPLSRAAALIAQCAAGLFAAHELGIVHRDLKPDNIMVLSGKEGEVAKLVDFGIAKAVEGNSSERLTRTGFMVGTPEYMSPEQLSGDPVGVRSDQYSLALVFYRMLTGRLPFEGTSLQETLVKRLTTPPRPLAISRPGKYPAGLQAVMDRALARDAADRYATVLEFSDAVSAAVAGEAAATRKLAQPPPVAGPKPTARLAAGVLGALLLGTATWGALRLTRSTPPVDSLRTNPLATRPAPPPAPLPAASEPRPHEPTVPGAPPQNLAASPVTAPAADTAELSLNALETPALRGLEIQRARRMLRMPRLSPERRARAAAFLGTVALDAGKPDTARILFRLAWQLDPRPLYRQQLLLVGDTIPR
jgi:serine/threonine-protein kinase